MKFHVLALAVAAIVAVPAFAAGEQTVNGIVGRTVPANKPAVLPQSTEVLDANAFYSNITTFTGSSFQNGGAAADPALAGNTITRLLCDDTIYNAPVARSLSTVRFAIANVNAATVSARPRIRFFSDAAGVPGALIGGASFAAIAFAPGVTTVSSNPFATPIAFPGTGAAVKVWSCVTFDNGTGATGATVADLNNLGMGVFNPPDRGSSADTYFRTTTNGSFFAPNPPGATANFGGAPVANFGWELIDAATMPVELQSFEVN